MSSKRIIVSLTLLLHLSVACMPVAVAANRGIAELDEQDRQELNTHLERASACAKAGDFGCALKELGIARKFANGSRDNQTISAAAQAVELERQRQMFADAQGKYADERKIVAQNAVEAEREATATNRSADRMAAHEDAERRSRELASRDDSSRVTPADIINRQIQKNAAEARTMIRQVNRETAAANAQIARASEQKRIQDRGQNESRTGSASSSRTMSSDEADRSSATSATSSRTTSTSRTDDNRAGSSSQATAANQVTTGNQAGHDSGGFTREPRTCRGQYTLFGSDIYDAKAKAIFNTKLQEARNATKDGFGRSLRFVNDTGMKCEVSKAFGGTTCTTVVTYELSYTAELYNGKEAYTPCLQLGHKDAAGRAQLAAGFIRNSAHSNLVKPTTITFRCRSMRRSCMWHALAGTASWCRNATGNSAASVDRGAESVQVFEKSN